MKVVLLASGAGSLASAIFTAMDSQGLDVEIALLISDKQSPVLERAAERNIPTLHLPMTSDRSLWNRKMLDAVAQIDPDLVVSVGFMRILAPEFVERFRVINTHPALLPLFPGAHAVRDALAAGIEQTGTSVHWVDAGVDTGKVISQRRVAIEAGDTEETLHERIKIEERLLIVETLHRFANHGIEDN